MQWWKVPLLSSSPNLGKIILSCARVFVSLNVFVYVFVATLVLIIPIKCHSSNYQHVSNFFSLFRNDQFRHRCLPNVQPTLPYLCVVVQLYLISISYFWSYFNAVYCLINLTRLGVIISHSHPCLFIYQSASSPSSFFLYPLPPHSLIAPLSMSLLKSVHSFISLNVLLHFYSAFLLIVYSPTPLSMPCSRFYLYAWVLLIYVVFT